MLLLLLNLIGDASSLLPVTLSFACMLKNSKDIILFAANLLEVLLSVS